MSGRLRIVSVCRTLPSPDDVSSGIFVLNRIQAMAHFADVQPVHAIPYFPVARPLPQWARARSRVAGQLSVLQAPMLYLPGVAKSLDATWLRESICKVILELHRAKPIDLIDAHFGYPEGVACASIGRKLGIPVCITIRGFEIEFADRPIVGPTMLGALSNVKGLVAVSESMRRFAVEHGVDPAKVRVIRNAVDTKHFVFGPRAKALESLQQAAEGPLIVSVGHIIPRKRHHHLIEAFASVAATRPTARLVIYGSLTADPDYVARIRSDISELELESRVTLAGNVAPSKLVQWLQAADLFALATAREGCCNAVLEALAVGTPVVTTDAGDNAEFIVPGRNGLLVPIDDPEALSNAIVNCLSSVRWARQQNSSRFHSEVGDWNHVGERVIRYFEELLASP